MQIGSDYKYSSLLMQIGSDSKTSRVKEKLKDKEQKLFWVLLFNNNYSNSQGIDHKHFLSYKI